MHSHQISGTSYRELIQVQVSINRSTFGFECLSDLRTFVWRKWVFGQNSTLSTILREYVYWEGRCWLMQPHSTTTATRYSERLQCSSAPGITEASMSLPSTWVTSHTQMHNAFCRLLLPFCVTMETWLDQRAVV